MFKHLLAKSAREWELAPRLVILIGLAPFFVAFSGAMAALLSDGAYQWLTGEDRFAENLQIFCWAFALSAGILVMGRLWKAGQRGFALLYFCLNAGIFFIIGEELSWGQRIFGWATPESIKAVNRQRETNIHSLDGLVSIFRWLHFAIGAYGTLLPLMLVRLQERGRHQYKISLLVPHYTLVPYFLAVLAWRIYLNFWHLPKQYYGVLSRYSEVVELILAMGFFLFMSFQLRKKEPHG